MIKIINEDKRSSNHFQVGDKMDYTGLYGGNYSLTVLSIKGDLMKVRSEWIAEDTLKDTSATMTYEITTDPKGNECIEVWHYSGEVGRVYPPSR